MVTGHAALDRSIINKYQGVVSTPIMNAIADASRSTGADFAYLMEKASVESGFNPNAKAKSSSATGLFQFIDKTWLSMIAQHGEEHGLGAVARQIRFDKDGAPHVDDPSVRRQILDLRKNPRIAAVMAGEFASDNKDYLQGKLKEAVGSAELYLAHFFGAGKAASFLKEMKENPMQTAAALFRTEASANKNVFFDSKTGKPKTLQQIYDFFSRKFDGAPSSFPPSRSFPAPVEFASGEKPRVTPQAAPPLHRTINPVEIMIMAEMSKTLSSSFGEDEKRDDYSSFTA